MKNLNANELEELQLWQKRMITVLVTTVVALLFVVGVDLIIGMSRRQTGVTGRNSATPLS